MNTPNDLDILRRSFRYLQPYRHYLIGIYAAMLLINLINVTAPQLIRLAIDDGIYQADLSRLGWLVLLLLGLTLIKGVIIYLQGAWTEVSSQHVAYDLRNALLRKLASLSFAFHDQAEAGQILSRAMQDVERIRFLTGRAVLRLVEGAVLILLTAVSLLTLNVTLTLLILLIIPLFLNRAINYGRQLRPLSFEIQDQLGNLTTRVEQTLRGTRVVKAFAQERAEIDRFHAQNETWLDLSLKAVRIQALNGPLLELIASVGTIAIFGYGGWLVMQGQLSLGELVAFVSYMALLLRPVANIGRILPILAIAASAGERLFGILDATSDVQDVPHAQPLPRLQGKVQFDNVSFGYANGKRVLHNISFTAQPGQVVAIMGATGSGKSTLVNLIARFYEPTNGRILLDNHDATQTTLASLRNQIGLVMQNSVLFAASIRENLLFGRPDATKAQMIQAAKDAQAHDFIMATPNGYDTRIGERGVTLSGGQKQRLAIARALLTDPRLLLLDDATASVDTVTEKEIQAALQRLMAGRTTFVIAHRLSTVRRADLILFLENGRLTASGTHEQLLQTSPLYAQVHALQVRPETARELT